MPDSKFAFRYIRVATKERPADRFLTAQVREGLASEDERLFGDFYFLVEILNPWFPNSHIGQTIINTIVREFRRGQSTSVLTNFELALRKTNQVLAQITQSGETDWIGNLSSIILLHAGEHVYIAQTGNAHAYLMRNTKISEITEGLEAEASQHPLTTYTNITSGTLETGDRILLATSQSTEVSDTDELSQVLNQSDLSQTGREFVRFLQQKKAHRLYAFIIEANPESTVQSETLYIDQSLNHPTEIMHRIYHRTLKPAASVAASRIAHHTNQAIHWTREKLAPSVNKAIQSGSSTLTKHTQNIFSKTQPLLEKTTQGVNEKISNLKPSTRAKKIEEDEEIKLEGKPIAGQAIYQVHHYEDQPQPKKIKGIDLGIINKTGNQFLNSITTNFSKIFKTLPAQKNRWLLLGCAALIIIIIIGFALTRHTKKTEQITQNQATAALAEAKTAVTAAERAYVLNDKATARTKYLEAVDQAKIATNDVSSHDEAVAIITQSQSILDQLNNATRVSNDITPITSLSEATTTLNAVGTKLLALNSTNPTGFIVTDGSATTPQSVAFSVNPTTSVATDDSWLALLSDQSVSKISTDGTLKKTTLADNLETSAIWAYYANSLYLIDAINGQISKHSYDKTKNQLAAGKAYLKTADTTTINKAKSLAIDGDVYLLLNDGSVIKYTKGQAVSDWKIHGLMAGETTIAQPIAIFASEGSDKLYVLDQNMSGTNPRLIEFDKNGAYTKELYLPESWQITGASFNPDTKNGYIVADQKVYKITF